MRLATGSYHAAAEAVMPIAKKLMSLRLDADVVDWFKQQGPGYQTRMNAVLRAFVNQSEKRQIVVRVGGSAPPVRG